MLLLLLGMHHDNFTLSSLVSRGADRTAVGITEVARDAVVSSTKKLPRGVCQHSIRLPLGGFWIGLAAILCSGTSL